MSIGIANIEITRIEGNTDLDNFKPHTFDSMVEANSYIKDIASSAPEHGGYDKVDFKVTFEDEETYTGRYDLKRDHTTTGDLGDHMRSFVRFYTGRSCPAHMTPEQYEEFIAQCDVDTNHWIDFLCTYDF